MAPFNTPQWGSWATRSSVAFLVVVVGVILCSSPATARHIDEDQFLTEMMQEFLDIDPFWNWNVVEMIVWKFCSRHEDFLQKLNLPLEQLPPLNDQQSERFMMRSIIEMVDREVLPWIRFNKRGKKIMDNMFSIYRSNLFNISHKNDVRFAPKTFAEILQDTPTNALEAREHFISRFLWTEFMNISPDDNEEKQVRFIAELIRIGGADNLIDWLDTFESLIPSQQQSSASPDRIHRGLETITNVRNLLLKALLHLSQTSRYDGRREEDYLIAESIIEQVIKCLHDIITLHLDSHPSEGIALISRLFRVVSTNALKAQKKFVMTCLQDQFIERSSDDYNEKQMQFMAELIRIGGADNLICWLNSFESLIPSQQQSSASPDRIQGGLDTVTNVRYLLLKALLHLSTTSRCDDRAELNSIIAQVIERRFNIITSNMNRHPSEARAMISQLFRVGESKNVLVELRQFEEYQQTKMDEDESRQKHSNQIDNMLQQVLIHDLEPSWGKDVVSNITLLVLLDRPQIFASNELVAIMKKVSTNALKVQKRSMMTSLQEQFIVRSPDQYNEKQLHFVRMKQMQFMAELIRIGGADNLIGWLDTFESKGPSQQQQRRSWRIPILRLPGFNPRLRNILHVVLKALLHLSAPARADFAIDSTVLAVIQRRLDIITFNMSHHRDDARALLEWMETKFYMEERHRPIIENTIKELRKKVGLKRFFSNDYAVLSSSSFK